MALPRFMVIQSRHFPNYLRYEQADPDPWHGFLKFTEVNIVSPYTKFEVETAKSGNGLVHIRCCYNNKYWVTKSSSNNYIVADADEREENQSLWSCTLFKPIPDDGNANTFRFCHVQRGLYVSCWTICPNWACLIVESNSPASGASARDIFLIIDWESLVILPKNVAFKGNNQLYLSARWVQRYRYLQFASNDNGDPTVANEVFITRDGSIRIKNNYFGKFWRRSPNWIWADSDDTTNRNSDTLFRPVKVADNVIALRNLGNNNFCKSLTTEGKKNCLNAAVGTITKEAQLVVEELVISRSIYNVNYRLSDKRVYGESIIGMASATATNHYHIADTVSLRMSYKDTRRSTWNSSVSLKLGIKATFQAGIPLIAKGKIDFNADFNVDFNARYEWGETVTTETEVGTTYTTTVKPMTKTMVSLLATRGMCDIPFTYTQRDTLMNGEQVICDMDDGIFTGINSYNYYYETKHEDLR